MSGPPTAPARGGRTRLIHAMALVAAVALALAGGPAVMRAVVRAFGPASSWNWQMVVDGSSTLSLVLWSMLLAPSALRAAGSTPRRDGFCPGHAAILAIAASLALLVVEELFQAIRGVRYGGLATAQLDRSYALIRLGSDLHEIPARCATAAIAAWLTLTLARSGRRPRDLTGWASLLTGVAWVVWSFSNPVVTLLRSFPIDNLIRSASGAGGGLP